LGSSAQIPFAVHGYGAYYCLSLMDRGHYPDITLEEAKGLMKKCIQELQKRFIVNLPEFKIKVVDADGIRDVELL
jgi:20S proteasome subunit beta 4